MMGTLRRSPAVLADLSLALARADLPIEDMSEPRREFFQFERDGVVVGYGGLERYGSDVLLRSVVVLPQHRARGDGKAITNDLLGVAHSGGAETAYLLTTTAESFFRSLGFEGATREDAPATILGTRQATSICSSAPLLRRSTAA